MTTTLHALAYADLDSGFAWESAPRASRMAVFTREHPADRAALDAHYRRIRAEPSVLVLAVVHDGQPAGTIGSFHGWRRGLEKAGFRLADEQPWTVTRRGVEVTELTLVLE